MLNVFIVGCTGQAIVPVSDLTSPKSHYAARVVRTGDTLYMIAWETGLDHRLLAKWNELREPFTITVGQRIRLTAPRESSGVGSNNGKVIVRTVASQKPTGSKLEVDSDDVNFDEYVKVSGSKKVGNWTASSSTTQYIQKDVTGDATPQLADGTAAITLTDGSITYKLGDAAHLSTAEKAVNGPMDGQVDAEARVDSCLLYTSPRPRDRG